MAVLFALFFTKPGQYLLLTILSVIAAVIAFWMLSWLFFAFFMPEHFAHIRQVMDDAGSDPNLMLRNVFENYFPWQY